MKITQWKFAGASVIGTSHESKGKECEDSWGGVISKTGEILCLCVADGAGTAIHARIGATKTTKWLPKRLTNDFDVIFASNDESLRTLICTELQNHLRRVAKRRGHDLCDYACTVVAVVLHCDGRWLAFHIGDGGIVGLFEDGLHIISAPKKGEYANETFFITNHLPEQYMSIIRSDSFRDNVRLKGVALFSDGVEGSLIDRRENTVAKAVEKMIGWLKDNKRKKSERALKKSLEETFRKKSSDDCTVAICLCPPPPDDD